MNCAVLVLILLFVNSFILAFRLSGSPTRGDKCYGRMYSGFQVDRCILLCVLCSVFFGKKYLQKFWKCISF